jgi:hypothetical protein
MREKYIAKIWQTPEKTLLEEWIVWSLSDQAKQVSDKSSKAYVKTRLELQKISDKVWSKEWEWITSKLIEWIDPTIPWIEDIIAPVKWLNTRFKNGNASLSDLNDAKLMLARYEKIYDDFWRVRKTGDEFEKQAIAKMYNKMKTEIEDFGKIYDVDIEKLNKETQKREGLRWLMDRAVSREAGRDMISLSDYVLWWITMTDPLTAVPLVLWKKIISSPKITSRIAKSLYTKDISNVRNNNSVITSTTDRITKQRLKWLPLKPWATVFPWSKWQLGNAEAPYKPNPSIRETGVIGQPYKKPVTPPKLLAIINKTKTDISNVLKTPPPKLPTIINKTKTDISNVLKTTPPPKLQAKSTIKLKSEFISPVSGKVQDPMKIPHDWASYSSADKTKYMDSLNKFNKSVAPKAPIQAKAKVNKEIPKEFTKYKNWDFGDLNTDIELYNYTKKYWFNAIDNTKRAEILRKWWYDKIEAQLRTEWDKLGKLPPAIVKQKVVIPKAPVKANTIPKAPIQSTKTTPKPPTLNKSPLEQANKSVKIDDSLLTEARKYKSAEEFVEIISDKLYALNKKAKEYRGAWLEFSDDNDFLWKTQGTKWELERDRLYSIKNKIISKYWQKTGAKHKFWVWFWEEFNIEWKWSFHNYTRYADDVINREFNNAIKDMDIWDNFVLNNNYYKAPDNFWYYIGIKKKLPEQPIKFSYYDNRKAYDVTIEEIAKKKHPDEEVRYWRNYYDKQQIVSKIENAKTQATKDKYNWLLKEYEKKHGETLRKRFDFIEQNKAKRDNYIKEHKETQKYINNLEQSKEFKDLTDAIDISKYKAIWDISSENIKWIELTDQDIELLDKLSNSNISQLRKIREQANNQPPKPPKK